jgi:hypothetical protein
MIPFFFFTLQKWRLLLGDVALTLLVTYLSPLIRLCKVSNLLYHYTGQPYSRYSSAWSCCTYLISIT